MPPKTCFPAADAPRYLRPTYSCFLLIAHRRHLDANELGDPGVLVVCSDWFLWQELCDQGRHAVFAMSGGQGHTPSGPDPDIYNDINDWIYLNADDATRFRGVSLGRKSVFPLAMLLAEHAKLTASLEALSHRYRPDRYIYRDYRADRGELDTNDRWALVSEIAIRLGIEIVDRRDPVADGDSEFPSAPHARRTLLGQTAENSAWSPRVRGWAILLMDLIARTRRLFDPSRPRVLLAATALTTTPLIEAFDTDGRTFAMVLGRWLPGKRHLGSVLRRLFGGLLPVDAPDSGLSHAELDTVDAIERRLVDAWQAPCNSRLETLRRFVRKYVLVPGRLKTAAIEVKWAERLLDRHRPDCVLTDGLQNTSSSTLVEVAKRRGVQTAAVWHSPHYHDVKLDMFGGDRRIESLAATALTWGSANEDWLDRTEATAKTVRTGCITAVPYLPMRHRVNARRRALLLQYNLSFVDAASWRPQDEYEVFVATARLLVELGVPEIRLRLHPTEPRASYYRRLIAYFDLRCEISVGRSYYDDLSWADFVIGPAASGAMVEALAARRPYYPVLLPPHSVDMTHLKGAVYEDLESLEAALKRGDSPPEQDRLREAFTSLEEIPDPARRAWDVLVEMATRAP